MTTRISRAFMVSPSSSFSLSSSLGTATRTTLHSKLFDDTQDDDEDLINSKASSSNSGGGDALAKEFYRQWRERQESGSDSSSSGNESPSNSSPSTSSSGESRLTETQKRDQNAKPFSQRRVMSVAKSTNSNNDDDKDTTPTSNSNNGDSTRKYTGQLDSSLFGNVPPGTATRERQSPRETMMEREFQLAGRGAGLLGLGIPAGVAVFALVFYIYIGLSGGIVSGGGGRDFGGDDMLEYEQVIPVPRDTERSVWI